jgi:hypothetical protein
MRGENLRPSKRKLFNKFPYSKANNEIPENEKPLIAMLSGFFFNDLLC